MISRYVQMRLEHKGTYSSSFCISEAYNKELHVNHDDVIKSKHNWLFVTGINRSPVNSPTKASDADLKGFLFTPGQTNE